MTFSFKCYRDLKLRLGELDAVVQCTEVAVRQFESEARQANSIGDFISEMGERHGIGVRIVKLDMLRTNTAQLYLIAVQQSVEQFLHEFKEQHPNEDWNDDDDDDLMSRIAVSVGMSRGSFEYRLYDYYRGLRNQYVHFKARQRAIEKGPTELLKRLQEEAQKDTAYAKYKAPNPIDSVAYDDFVLFTSASKRLAEELCIVGRPDDQTLLRLAREKYPPPHKRGNSERRLKNGLIGHIQAEFSLEPEEAARIVDVAD